MSKRALILWVCLGTLLLSAAKVTTTYEPKTEDTAPGVMSALDEDLFTQDAEQPNFELLSAAYSSSQPPATAAPLAPPSVEESTLWLARAIYSETKVPHEQELVAWVIRNRVETGYRGRTTYRDVVLDPYQFSAFNPGASRRSFFLNLTPEIQLPAWQRALWIAHYVRNAAPVYRPFSIETRHFYSERSMTGRRHPYWVNGHQFVTPGLDYAINERRFRFYKEIS